MGARINGRVICTVNQKGGVGKTTTAVNLATGLAAVGKRVLLIDFDPQGNASTGLGVNKNSGANTIYDVLCGSCEIAEASHKTFIPNLEISPSNVDLAGSELELVTVTGREYVLKEATTDLRSKYDFTVIDCPPSLSLLTINAMVASDALLVPLQCEYYALEGLSYLMKTFELVRKRLNPDLEMLGVLLTMFDKRNKLSGLIEQDVRSVLKEKVFDTVVPRNVKVSEAPSHGKPAIIYDLNCTGSQAYLMLAREVLKRTARLNSPAQSLQAA